jgi:hypothetical protein
LKPVRKADAFSTSRFTSIVIKRLQVAPWSAGYQVFNARRYQASIERSRPRKTWRFLQAKEGLKRISCGKVDCSRKNQDKLVAGADRDQRHKSANNARLSEYVLWKNRYAQVSPCFQSRVHPEYIDKARDIEGLSTKEISDTVLTSTCNTSINDKLRYERKRQVSTPSRKKCGHLLRTSPEEREPWVLAESSRQAKRRRHGPYYYKRFDFCKPVLH